MTKTYLNIFILAFISALSITSISAQDAKSDKTVVIVEKTIDKDGNVQVEKVVKKGDDAEKYLIKMEKEGLHDENIKIHKEVIVDNKQAYKIVKIDDDGNKEVIEWTGEGEMPEDVRKMMEEEGVDVDVDNFNAKKVRIHVSEDGEDEEIIIDMDEEYELEFGSGDDEDKEVRVRIIKEEDSRKAQLGVIIEDAEEGVEIIELVEGAAAERAGMRVGDIITHINDQATDGIEALVNSVKDREPGEEVKIRYIRDGEPVVRKVALEAFSMHEHLGEDQEKMIIIKKKKD